MTQLHKDLRRMFLNKVESDPKLQEAFENIKSGKGTYINADEYAYQIGSALSEVFGENLSATNLENSSLMKKFAETVLRPLLEEQCDLVSKAAVQVQESLNKKANIGLKVQVAPEPTDRINGLTNKFAAAASYDDAAWILDEPVKNLAQSVVTDTMKTNVELHGRAGLMPKIIRKAESKCCDWCTGLAGVYDYPEVPDDVYRRHERCRCTVDYDPRNGKRQNVHTKQWKSTDERAKIEQRKQLGLKSLAQQIYEHPKRLASYSPASLKQALEQSGFEVKPLKQGSLRNIPFENGGGYKVNFEDGGLLQYHPASKSHHGGAYYKISTGKGGTHRYELDGTEKQND